MCWQFRGPPIDPPSVVDQIVSQLRWAIVRGMLGPGQKISLRPLIARLGVSFIPVREALRILAADGLVLLGPPGHSATVAPLDAADLFGLSRLRRVIEPQLAARACALWPAGELTRLEAPVTPVAPSEPLAPEVFEASLRFDRELLRPATTSWDEQELERLWLGTARYLHLGRAKLVGEPPGKYRTEAEQQRELLAAFRTHNPTVVRTTWQRRLDRDEAVAMLALAPGPAQ